jgi:hypothetical protein
MDGCAGVWGAAMAATRSINTASFATTAVAIFAFSFASLEQRLAFSIA